MAFKDTVLNMRDLLVNIMQDLQKAAGGNKAASQRVRTGTVRLEKVAKAYRKESIKAEKSMTKTAKKSSKRPTAKVASKSSKPAKAAKSSKPAKSAKSSKPATAKKTAVKAKAKAKAHRAHPRAMSFKKPSAKLPAKR